MMSCYIGHLREVILELAELVQTEEFDELCSTLDRKSKVMATSQEEATTAKSPMLDSMSPFYSSNVIQADQQHLQERKRKRISTNVSVYSDTEFNDERGKKWSDELDRILEDGILQDMSWYQIAPIVGRTEAACQSRYRKLKSTRQSSDNAKADMWTEEQDKILIDARTDGQSWREVAALLGNRTESACSRRFHLLKIASKV